MMPPNHACSRTAVTPNGRAPRRSSGSRSRSAMRKDSSSAPMLACSGTWMSLHTILCTMSSGSSSRSDPEGRSQKVIDRLGEAQLPR